MPFRIFRNGTCIAEAWTVRGLEKLVEGMNRRVYDLKFIQINENYDSSRGFPEDLQGQISARQYLWYFKK